MDVCTRVLVLSGAFPSHVQPVYGVFVKERLRFLAQRPDVDLRVISPTPYFPPIKACKRWYPWSQIPREEVIDGMHVERPRYPFVPKLGGYIHPRLMFPAVIRATKKLMRRFECDVIDSHFVYPNGVVATRLGKRLNRPVVITGRGEDIERFPDLPLIGSQIRRALHDATALIAVSERIAERMRLLGADPEKIAVIPNGVDCEKFYPIPTDVARGRLGLPQDRPLILAVGYRLELKGFHLLVDAIPAIKQRFPDVLVAIVGGQARWAADFLPEIEARISANKVQDHVILAGNRPQEELPAWYSAGDVLAILSSREGSPNVLMEALACGLPAVATRVGGIPDILSGRDYGILLDERSPAAAARGLIEMLERQPDRARIREDMLKKSWHETAHRVNEVFARAIAEYPCPRTA